MAKNSVKTLEIPGNRGWMVISLGEVDRPSPKDIEPARVAAIAQPLGPAFGNELVSALAAEAKRRATVQIDKDLLEQLRSEEPTSELPSLMRISYAVFCLIKKTYTHEHTHIRLAHHYTTLHK